MPRKTRSRYRGKLKGIAEAAEARKASESRLKPAKKKAVKKSKKDKTEE